MKLTYVGIENFRAIERLDLEPDPALTVFHGDNAHGKTSILDAIAVGLGRIPTPIARGIGHWIPQDGSAWIAPLAGHVDGWRRKWPRN